MAAELRSKFTQHTIIEAERYIRLYSTMYGVKCPFSADSLAAEKHYNITYRQCILTGRQWPLPRVRFGGNKRYNGRGGQQPQQQRVTGAGEVLAIEAAPVLDEAASEAPEATSEASGINCLNCNAVDVAAAGACYQCGKKGHIARHCNNRSNSQSIDPAAYFSQNKRGGAATGGGRNPNGWGHRDRGGGGGARGNSSSSNRYRGGKHQRPSSTSQQTCQLCRKPGHRAEKCFMLARARKIIKDIADKKGDDLITMSEVASSNAFDASLNDYNTGIIALAENVSPDEVDETIVALLSYGPTWGQEDSPADEYDEDENIDDPEDDPVE